MLKPLENEAEREFYENFGEKLKKTRKFRRIRRADMAKELGITEQSLGLYERGLIRFSAYRYVKICHLLDIFPETDAPIK